MDEAHSALDTLRAHYRDPLRAARHWAADGGKVVGYLCDNVPTELIAAAGFLPLRVTGDPAAGRAAVEGKVDRLYPPDVTNRAPFVGAMLNRLLDGTYAVLDHLVVPHNRNAIQAIYRELRDAARADPALKLPSLHYLDKAWAPHASARAFDAESVARLADELATWRGAPIEEAALAAAVEAAETQRTLLRRVLHLRSAEPPRLSGADALAIFGTAMLIPVEKHVALVEAVLSQADALTPRPGPRVFVGGSPQDHPALYELIEAQGATVVSEDHCWGARIADYQAPPGLGPMQRIVQRFQTTPACSIRGTLAETVNACTGRATSARAEAAIFYVEDQDWSQNWETPSEIKRLKAAGIPCLHLSARPYDVAADASLADTIAAFLADLPRAAA